MRLLPLILCVSVLLFLSSCNAYKPADEAFYITAPSVSVSTTSLQGSGSHKITDLWLYVNNQFKGCYPVGNLMPVVSKGDPVRITAFAGIKNNGISGTRIFWPFYESIIIDTMVESGTKVLRPFKFRYAPSTKFAWIEDFDQSGRTVVKSQQSERDYKVITGAEAFENGSLTLAIDGATTLVEVESSQFLTLPRSTSNVYLELDYKCNQEFDMGLLGEDGTAKHVFRFNAQNNWNKIYLQLAETINSPPASNKYKVYFRLLAGDNPDARIYLDNIKVVHF